MVANSADGRADELPWQRVYFAHDGLQGADVKSTAISIPAGFDGLSATGIMQLDLGSYRTVVYGKPYEALSARSQKAANASGETFAGYKTKAATFSGTIAGCRFAGADLPILQDFGDEPEKGQLAEFGTVGADFFENRILVMDFVEGRIAVLDGDAQLPASLVARARFGPLTYKRGLIYVNLKLNGRDAEYLYDTGSDSFPLLTSRRGWQSLTGLKGDESGLTRWLGMSWGKQHEFLGAPLKGDMCLEQDCMSHPLVFFDSSVDNERRFKGLFGDAFFQDHYIVIVDVARRRIGLLRQ